jgi:hypothetical protein
MANPVSIQQTIEGEKRTSRIEILCGHGAIPLIIAEREIRTNDNKRIPQPEIRMTLDQFPVDQTVSVDGMNLNALQIAEAVKKILDLQDPA